MSCESARVSAYSQDNFGHFFQGNLFTRTQLLLLLLNLTPTIPKDIPDFVGKDLIESFFSSLMNLSSFVLLAKFLIFEFVGEELGGVVVVADELVIPVDLVSESAFLDEGLCTAPSLMSSTGVWQ